MTPVPTGQIATFKTLADFGTAGLLCTDTVPCLTPDTAEAVAAILSWLDANRQPIAFNLADAQLLKHPLWLDMSGLQAIRMHQPDDFIVTVETGMTFDALNVYLAPFGQQMPLSYPPGLQIFEALGEDSPGLETGFYGQLRDYVLKVEWAAPDGQLAISGADVVKNVAGYDLHKFLTGGRHAFGLLTAVTLKLLPLPAVRHNLLYTLPTQSSEPAFLDVQTLLDSHFPLIHCELIRTPFNTHWQLSLQCVGEAGRLQAPLAQLRKHTEQHDWQTMTAENLANESNPLEKLWELTKPGGHGLQLEIALPHGQWPTVLQQVASLLSTEIDWLISARPAAGLIHLQKATDTLIDWPLILQLQALAISVEGFLQIVAMPASAWHSTGESSKEAVSNNIRAVNLPADPTISTLLKTLKQGYDPNNILFTPLLPL